MSTSPNYNYIKYIPVLVYGLDSELKFPGGQAKEQFLFPNCIAHAPERPPTFSIEIDESPTTVLWLWAGLWRIRSEEKCEP